MALGPILTDLLKQYGLTSLTSWASNAIINGLSEAEVELEMWKQPAFKTRFAGIFALEAGGYPPMSVDEYLAYEQTIHAQASMWGVTLSKSEVDNLIGNNVSNVEAKGRFDLAAEAMFESDDETVAELRRMGGIGNGPLIKYFMNPKKEFGNLQSSFRQSQIAGAALRTGWGQLTQQQAERLQQVGMSREQATEGFGELTAMEQILEGWGDTDIAISQGTQVEALAGDVEAQQQIETKRRKREAEFEGGGEFGQSETGFNVGAATQ